MATGRLPGHLISFRTTLSGDDPANIPFFLPLGGVLKWIVRYSNTSVRATSERHNQKPSQGSAAGFVHWKNSIWNPGVLRKAQERKSYQNDESEIYARRTSLRELEAGPEKLCSA